MSDGAIILTVAFGGLAVIIAYIVWCVRSSGKQARRRHERANGWVVRTREEIRSLPETREHEKAA